MIHDTYTQFDKVTGKVKGRLTVPKGTVLPEGEFYVKGFFSSDYIYSHKAKAPLIPEPLQIAEGGRVEGRAFGDNVSFEMINPYFAVHMWYRTE